MLRLWLRGQHGVPLLCTVGLSGWAPCRLRRHGHSASIPHAFAPAALRAMLGAPDGPEPAASDRQVSAKGESSHLGGERLVKADLSHSLLSA